MARVQLNLRVSRRLILLLDQCAKITGKPRSRLVREGITHAIEANLGGRGASSSLSSIFRELQFYVAKLDVPTIRESLVAKLQAVIDDIHRRAQKSKDEKTRLEYYRVMGYICQILNGLLEDVSMDELTRRIDEAKAVVETQQKRSGANG